LPELILWLHVCFNLFPREAVLLQGLENVPTKETSGQLLTMGRVPEQTKVARATRVEARIHVLRVRAKANLPIEDLTGCRTV
jgi:hypothetical protein